MLQKKEMKTATGPARKAVKGDRKKTADKSFMTCTAHRRRVGQVALVG